MSKPALTLFLLFTGGRVKGDAGLGKRRFWLVQEFFRESKGLWVMVEKPDQVSHEIPLINLDGNSLNLGPVARPT
jgi:hypothetical protein